MPRAVAILPTADRAEYIDLALRCFEKQTVENKILIIVDNGREPIYGRARFVNGEVIYCRVEPVGPGNKLNHGQIMNACCELASPSDVIFAWDDDDWYASTRMEQQLALLSSSGKQVTGYHNLLYYDTATGLTYKYEYEQKPPLYASGSSQAFTHEFWSRHSFPEKPKGADGDFSRKAKELGEIVTAPGLDMLVARAHKGNTCPPPLGKNRQFPAYPRDRFPQAFFDDLQAVYGGEPKPVEGNRVLIGIATCHKNTARRDLQRSTWLPFMRDGFDYAYFTGEPYTRGEKDVITLPVPDDYEKLTLKTRSMIRYAYDSGYTHLFKCDDDTFVIPDRLVIPDCDYTGHTRIDPPNNDGVSYCRGFGYWLSRKAMKAVLDAPTELFASGKIEDGAVAKALKLAGITPVHDDRYTAEPHTFPTKENDAIACHTLTPAFMAHLGGILTSKDAAQTA